MSWYKFVIHSVGIAAITLVIALAITWSLAQVPMLAPVTDSVLDFEFTDQAFKDKNYHLDPRDTNIFIVNVAHHKRYRLTGIIDSINQYSPAVVCVDVIFRNQKEHFIDSLLINSLSKVDNLLFIAGIVEDQLYTSHKSFISHGQVAFGNLIEGLKNRIRDFHVKTTFNGKKYEHIGVAASRFVNAKVTDHFLRRQNEVETINYIGGIQKYPVIDLNEAGVLEVFSSDTTGYFKRDKTLALEDVHEKIVILGYVAEDMRTFNPVMIDPYEAFHTPLPYFFSWLGDSGLPKTKGVVIQANIISTILNGRYIQRSLFLNYSLNIIIIVLCSALFFWISNKSPRHYGLITKALAVLAILVLIYLTITVFEQFSYKYDPRWAILVLLFLSDSTEFYIQYIARHVKRT